MIDQAVRPLTVAILAACVVLLVSACDDNPTAPEESLFTDVQSTVFSESCATSGCHSGDDPAGELNLSEGSSYSQLVNVASAEVPELMRVEPGNSEDSYLYIKIIGGDRIAPGTLRMPIGRELSTEQIALVEEWIDAGAER